MTDADTIANTMVRHEDRFPRTRDHEQVDRKLNLQFLTKIDAFARKCDDEKAAQGRA
jgi:hypothetical protein